jgi:osmotically-inducible protein OsmY
MRPDIQLQGDIQDELHWEPSLESAHIGVAVDRGVVTLTGTVPSYTQRVTAQRAAERVRGVKAIVNELEVRLPDNLLHSDGDLAKAVVDALRWRTTVPEDRVKVAVSQGWVSLEGDVDWHFQKASAEDVVRHLSGVKGITNAITIRPHATAADVKGRIEAAFRRNAELDATRVSVQVSDGKVSLHGMLPTWAERQEAERSAWSAPGVRQVENHIKITPSMT